MSKAVIIGGGPAGLAAAYYLSKNKVPVLLLEKDEVLGGLSRTVEYKGFRFDIGGHRFFTKSPEVNALWQEVLGQEFLKRPRLSRIFYRGKFFYYPLRPANALFGLGLISSIRILASLVMSKLSPKKQELSFEDWVSNRFGKELYRIFFKTYTEKVWGIPCTEISADWAAQRIRDLSLTKALLQTLGFGKKNQVASLIEEFRYPRLGPGQMYQRMGEKITGLGGRIQLKNSAERVLREGNHIRSVETDGPDGPGVHALDALFSSMPLTELVQKISPEPPAKVLDAARTLRYRSIVTVNFMLKRAETFKDTWLYIHSPQITAGRLQIYKNWSPDMVPDPDMSSVGLEYFCFEGDNLWESSDEELISLGRKDLKLLGFEGYEDIFDGFVVRYAKAYPLYEGQYKDKIAVIREFVDRFENLFIVGRYGQFRYNNMDHSILTAWAAVENIANGIKTKDNIWAINTESNYLEEHGSTKDGHSMTATGQRSQQKV